MRLFFDTSALAKLFHFEAGSKMVQSMVETVSPVISELAITEFYSATLRKHRDRVITESQVKEILSAFDEYVDSIVIEALSRAVIEQSRIVLKKYGKKFPLRSLDALQLSTFQLIAEDSWSFVVADQHLAALAKSIGIKTIIPA